MTRLKQFRKDNQGASLVEFTLLFPLLLALTFGIVETGYILYKQNTAQKATQLGGRYLSTRAPLVTGLTDCGVATAADAGTDCVNVPGADSWSVSCSNGSGGNCDAAIFADVLAEMQSVYPNLQASNLEVIFSGTGLGYVGRGKPVPAITVRLNNLTYNYAVLDKIVGISSALNLDKAQSTLIAEDIGEGTGA